MPEEAVGRPEAPMTDEQLAEIEEINRLGCTCRPYTVDCEFCLGQISRVEDLLVEVRRARQAEQVARRYQSDPTLAWIEQHCPTYRERLFWMAFYVNLTWVGREARHA